MTGTGGASYLAAEVEVFYYSDFDSAIIPEVEQRTFLTSIGLEKESLTSIYRASANGFSATSFHNQVVGYNKTLTIIKTTTGFVFGYFTNVMHNFTEAFVADSEAFMFSYSNVQNVTQKLSIVKPEMARYNNRAKYGPYFGNDTICPGDFDVNPCSLTFNAFTPPNGLPFGTAGSTYLINSTTFYPAEVEVFMLASVPDSQLVDTMGQPGLMRLIQLENTRMNLVHRASKNGFSAYDFHYNVSKVYLRFNHVG